MNRFLILALFATGGVDDASATTQAPVAAVDADQLQDLIITSGLARSSSGTT